MWNIFISVFIITALALMFAHAWNLVAETALSTLEVKKNGEVQKPVYQTLAYAICISFVCIFALWYIHYYTPFDLGEGFKRKHRPKQK